jgi:sterol desaturase/sphingolipid hydroxylase (fatty acid hydroxylase superfamily)
MSWSTLLDAASSFAATNRVVYFIGIFLVLMVVEGAVARRRRRPAYEAADTRANLLCGLTSLVVNAAVRAGIVVGFMEIIAWTPLELPADHWGTWLLAALLLDFCLYWAHRFSHETRLGWATHEVHHSSRRYNLSVALRQSWTTSLLSFFYLPLALIGAPMEVIIAVQSFSSIYQFWLHTEQIDRMPRWFEALFNTPSHHRVHHGRNPRYLDKNYGGVLIVWDRLFGTFEAEVERPVYGLTTPLRSHSVVTINLHAWRAMIRDVARAGSWRVALALIFSAPGEPLARRSVQPRVDEISDADVLLQSGASLSNMR